MWILQVRRTPDEPVAALFEQFKNGQCMIDWGPKLNGKRLWVKDELRDFLPFIFYHQDS
jgi:hypothetical protein